MIRTSRTRSRVMMAMTAVLAAASTARAIDLGIALVPGQPLPIRTFSVVNVELTVQSSTPGTYEYWDDLRLLLDVTTLDGQSPANRPRVGQVIYNPLGGRTVSWYGTADWAFRLRISWNQSAGDCYQGVVMFRLACPAAGTWRIRYYTGPGTWTYAACDGADVTGALGELVLTVAPGPWPPAREEGPASDPRSEISQADADGVRPPDWFPPGPAWRDENDGGGVE